MNIKQWVALGLFGLFLGGYIGLSLPSGANTSRQGGNLIEDKDVCVRLDGTVNGQGIDALRVMRVSHYLVLAESGEWDLAAVEPRTDCP